MKKWSFLFLLFSLLWQGTWATHNRAGEIVYRWKSGLTYEITIITYTDPRSTGADRCALTINFGDSTSQEVLRSNGDPNCSGTPAARRGVILSNVLKRNEYTTEHTFPGNGVYKLWMEDPNRNEGIRNVPNSVQIPFYLETYLIISPLSGVNSTPLLEFPPIDMGCVNQPYRHTPGAVDPDGDSLSYRLAEPLGIGGEPIFGFSFPNVNSGPGSLTIDQQFGIMDWDSPRNPGEYNIAIEILEWRRSPLTGQVVNVGIMRRDMQITINGCSNNIPEFLPIDELCVVGGQSVNETITAIDIGDNLTLTAVGDPFNVQSPAQFTNPVSDRDTVTQTFFWQTNCNHIRQAPYKTYFRVTDNRSSQELVNFLAFNIRVIGPPPRNVNAEPKGNEMTVSWQPPTCSNFTGYHVYRRVDSSGYVPKRCDIGVPDGLLFQRIATLNNPSQTEFIDNNNGAKLDHGLNYCYIVTAIYEGNYEGKASNEACAELRKDIPIITNVDVFNTAIENGGIELIWVKPTEIDDSVQYPGPYRYQIFRETEQVKTLVYTTTAVADLAFADTTFTDTLLNTENQQYGYTLSLISGNDTVGKTKTARSIFLSIAPSDRRLDLSWDVDVPWQNQLYFIYKFNQGSNTFLLLDSTSQTTYSDRNLVNEVPYTYYVSSRGKFSTDGIKNPLINRSQIAIGIPIDTMPPCAPETPILEGDCDLDQVKIQWKWNIADSCYSDVVKIRIYANTQIDAPFTLVEEIEDFSITERAYINNRSIAGCYYITAVDSFNNESLTSDTLCVDNCPIYTLPNVFTPNNDGVNDFFVPFPYKYVDRIQLWIYNRWGNLVFETQDPDIKWSGTNQKGDQMADGVYFYVCEVFEIRLTGIETRTIKGNVTLFNSTGNPVEP